MFLLALFLGLPWLFLGAAVLLLVCAVASVGFYEERDAINFLTPAAIILVIIILFAGEAAQRGPLGIDWQAIRSVFASITLWEYFGVYLLIGAVYFWPQFLITTNKQARHTREAWANWQAGWAEKAASMKSRAESQRSFQGDAENAELTAAESFARISPYSLTKLTKMVVSSANPATVEPVLRRDRLAVWMASWVCYWPFYLLNLIFKDLVREAAHLAVAMLGTRLQRMVTAIYKLN